MNPAHVIWQLGAVMQTVAVTKTVHSRLDPLGLTSNSVRMLITRLQMACQWLTVSLKAKYSLLINNQDSTSTLNPIQSYSVWRSTMRPKWTSTMTKTALWLTHRSIRSWEMWPSKASLVLSLELNPNQALKGTMLLEIKWTLDLSTFHQCSMADSFSQNQTLLATVTTSRAHHSCSTLILSAIRDSLCWLSAWIWPTLPSIQMNF